MPDRENMPEYNKDLVSAAVLVVEDEPLQRMMIIDLIEKAGFEALEAADAEDAVRILEARLDVRVVFTDIDMPGGLDGLKLAAEIRDRWPPIELIITSGRRRPKMEELPARGVFFAKPYRQEQVIDAVCQFINKDGTAGSTPS